MGYKFNVGDIVSHKFFDVCGIIKERGTSPRTNFYIIDRFFQEVDGISGHTIYYNEDDIHVDTKAKRLIKLREIGI